MKTASLKNLILLCTLLGSTIFFISCGDDGDEVNLSQEIVGTWERTSSDNFGTFTERLVFRTNLSGYQYFDGQTDDLFTFTYTVDGNVLIINFNVDGVLQSASGTFSIDNDVLSLDTDDGASITYSKVSDVPADEPVIDDDPTTQFVGTWLGTFDESTETLVMRADGTGYFLITGQAADEFDYSVSGDQLTFDFFVSEITVTYTVTETTLVITDPDGGIFTYTKTSDIPEEVTGCSYTNFAGTYTSYSDGTSTDTECSDAVDLDNFTSSVTITYISGSEESGTYTYSIDDAFGGMYIEWYTTCYGYDVTTSNQFTVNVSTGEVSGTWSSLFTDDTEFSMTGTYNSCTGVLRLNWTNVFGDEGRTTVFVL